jgi:uncharacterized protein YkwD
LDAHNGKRAQYGVPNLAWSTNLQTSAQNYANTLASGCTFAHSGGNYGTRDRVRCVRCAVRCVRCG